MNWQKLPFHWKYPTTNLSVIKVISVISVINYWNKLNYCQKDIVSLLILLWIIWAENQVLPKLISRFTPLFTVDTRRRFIVDTTSFHRWYDVVSTLKRCRVSTGCYHTSISDAYIGPWQMSTMEFFSGNSERPFAVIYLFIYFLFYIDYCFLKKLICLLT